MRRSVKYLISIILVTAFAMMLVGCGEKTTAKKSEGKEELVIAVDEYWADPKFDGGVATGTNIYEPLIFLNEKLEVKPGLATSWERIDALKWRISLREGVKFHNGKDFNADAAIYAFTNVMDKPEGWIKSRVESVVDCNSFHKINNYTLEITTLSPYPFFPYLLSHPYLVVMEPEAAQKGEIIGTGPFQLKEKVKDQYVAVEKFDKYWGQKPNFKRIVFKNVPDPNTRLLALQGGEADMALEPPKSAVKQFEGNKKYAVNLSPMASTVDLKYNYVKKPMEDVTLRKAISMSINRKEILDTVLEGIGSPARTMIPPDFMFSAEGQMKGLPYKPEEARKILEESGYKDTNGDGYREKDGKTVNLVLAFYSAPGYKEIAETVQAYLKAVGIKSDIVFWDIGMYWDEFSKGNFDVCVDFSRVYWGGSSVLIHDYFYSKCGLPGVWYHGLSAEIDKMIEEAMELEAAKKYKEAEEKYIIVQQAGVDEYMISYPICYEKNIIVHRSELSNLSPHPLMPFYNGATTRTLVQLNWK